MGPKIRLDLSYDGADFFGWQKQPRADQPTVQKHIETALKGIFKTEVGTLGAGRTDAGVHALHQVAHFTAPKSIERYNLHHALNRWTPPSIAIQRVSVAPDNFHALASSSGKIYKYLILSRQSPSALRARYTHWERRPLDLEFLSEVTDHVVGTHDFKSLQTKGTEVKSTTRHVRRAQWAKEGDLYTFTIEGEGFLKQMVRNLVGTALDLYYQGRKASEMAQILAAVDRQAAGTTAPPQGLYLCQVQYPNSLDIKCREI